MLFFTLHVYFMRVWEADTGQYGSQVGEMRSAMAEDRDCQVMFWLSCTAIQSCGLCSAQACYVAATVCF